MFEHRALALCGLAMIVWALPRLAKRCALDPGLVLWLGAANPLVLFHLVSGIHNESLMIGLLLVGLEIGLRAGRRLFDRHLLGGAALIVASSAVKLPALLALGFLGLEWARRRGGHLRDVAVVGGLLGLITVAIYTPLSVGTGVGLGWTRTLDTPALILSWMSASTDLGLIGGQVGIIGGLGDHTDTVLVLTRAVGLAGAAVLVGMLLLATLRGRIDAVTGIGAGLGAVVLLGPVVHPWYLLWAAIPLAATRGLPRHRRAALAASAVLAVVVPPTGADFNFRAYQLPMAVAAALIMLFLVLAWQRRQLVGSSGADVDALPGRMPAVPATPTPASSVPPQSAADSPPDRSASGRRLRRRSPSPPRPSRPRSRHGRRTRLRPVSPTPPAVSVRGLVKRYGRTTAVDGLDLELPRPPCWRCSAPTAPARPPPSRCAPGSCAPTPARSGCSASTRPARRTRCGPGSA